MKVRVNIMGRAVGPSQGISELELPGEATLADAVLALAAAMPNQAELSGSTLVILSGRHVGTLASYPRLPLQNNDELLLLSPIAGG